MYQVKIILKEGHNINVESTNAVDMDKVSRLDFTIFVANKARYLVPKHAIIAIEEIEL